MGKEEPVDTEVASVADDEAYERWLAEKIESSLNDKRRPIPHARVMSDMDAVIDQAERNAVQH